VIFKVILDEKGSVLYPKIERFCKGEKVERSTFSWWL